MVVCIQSDGRGGAVHVFDNSVVGICVTFQVVKAVPRLLYAAEDDPSVIAEAKAMVEGESSLGILSPRSQYLDDTPDLLG